VREDLPSAGDANVKNARVAEKHRAERAKREGQLDDYAAGLLEDPASDMTLWDFMRLWFREDAAPHLAESTLANYLQVANKWIRPIAGTWPLRAFEKPGSVNQLLVTGTVDRAGPPTLDRIRKILSSALTWGVEHRGDLIGANGCKQVTTRRHRRSGRARVSSPASRPERALSAEAAERVARAMLDRSQGRTWEPHRDAILLRCEFGLGLRPEEIAAARWSSLARPTPGATGSSLSTAPSPTAASPV
jgi:integrase